MTLLAQPQDTASTVPPHYLHDLNSADFRDLVRLIDRWATVTPGAVALASEREEVTYAQLVQRTNQLAHYLISLGAGRQDIVGICMDRSIEMVISALAVLKAGAAYLPLDPSYPRERIRLMLNDAHPRVVLTRADMLPQEMEGQWKIVDFDRELSRIQTFETDAPVINNSREDLAYVIYTSGSTGEPKGVQVTHGNLMNLVRWHQGAFAVTSVDRASVVASVSFDAAVCPQGRIKLKALGASYPAFLAEPGCID